MENIEEIIKEYLKDNMSVTVITEKHYGEFGDRDGFKVTVQIELDGEIISSSSDYSTL